MSIQKENIKKSDNEEIRDEKTELTDEELEQVNGGTYQLKKETQTYSKGGGAGKVNVNDLSFTKYVDE